MRTSRSFANGFEGLSIPDLLARYRAYILKSPVRAVTRKSYIFLSVNPVPPACISLPDLEYKRTNVPSRNFSGNITHCHLVKFASKIDPLWGKFVLPTLAWHCPQSRISAADCSAENFAVVREDQVNDDTWKGKKNGQEQIG